jgi:IS30 family transposase
MATHTTREERAERDQLIYRLHLAGISFRQIGKRIGMTPGGVHKIVRRELGRAADVRDDLVGDAEIEHLERMKQLYAAYAPKAQAGDLKAAEYCRRLLADMARIQGLNQSVAERLAPARDDDLDPEFPR